MIELLVTFFRVYASLVLSISHLPSVEDFNGSVFRDYLEVATDVVVSVWSW